MNESSSVSASSLKAQPLIPAPGSVSTASVPEVGFLDALIDTVNPLQHLPVVSSLYREASGDGISGLARIAGGALFGGIPGLITSAAVSLFDAVTGEDPGEIAISALKEITDTTETVASPTLDDGTPLAADSGQALVEVAAALKDAPPPPTPTEAAAADALKIPGALAAYREDSLALGFKEEGRREQYLGSLDEIAMKM